MELSCRELAKIAHKYCYKCEFVVIYSHYPEGKSRGYVRIFEPFYDIPSSLLRTMFSRNVNYSTFVREFMNV